MAPDANAGAVNAKLQFEIPGEVSDTGVQEKPLNPGDCWIVTFPPVPETDKAAADASAAPTF
jgi:hypothetical protein